MEVVITQAEDLAPYTKLKIEIPITLVKNRYNSEIDKIISKVQIAGFRKGKAPRTIVEKEYGGQSLEHSLAYEILEKEVEQYILKNSFELDGRPELLGETACDDKAHSFEVRIALKQELKVEKYKDLEIEYFLPFDIEEHKNTIRSQMLDRMGSYKEGTDDESPTEGDFVLADITCSVEGKALKKYEPFKPAAGSRKWANISEEFKKEVVKMKKGQESEFTAEVPNDHPSEWARGKSGQWKMKLGGFVKIIPADIAITDEEEKAKVLGNVETSVATALESSKDGEMVKALITKIVNENPFEIPQALIDTQIYNLAIAQKLIKAGHPPEQLNWNLLRGFYGDIAKERAKFEKILSFIIDKEGIEATDADLKEEAIRFGKEHNYNDDELLGIEDFKKGAISQLKFKKALDFLKTSNTFKEVEKK